MAEPTLPGKVIALSEALDDAKIRHAFGGAIALAYYANPRATIDIDLNIFLPPESFDDVAAAIGSLGVNTKVNRKTLERDGQCRTMWGRTPVDLFMANLEFHKQMARDARRQPFGNAKIRVLAPEHLLVCKTLFDRPKDWIDIEQMVLTMPDLKTDEVTAWLFTLAGRRDERTKRFVKLTRLTRVPDRS